MWKLAAILFIVIAPTLAGLFALVPITYYDINAYNPWVLVGFAVAGALTAVPVSALVATRILAAIKNGPQTTS